MISGEDRKMEAKLESGQVQYTGTYIDSGFSKDESLKRHVDRSLKQGI